MPIKVNKLDNKTFTPTGDFWQSQPTTEAAAVKYEDKGTDVYPNLVKESGGAVVWAKPFKLTITKVGDVWTDHFGNVKSEYPQGQNGSSSGTSSSSNLYRTNSLEPTKPNGKLPDADDTEYGIYDTYRKCKAIWNNSIFQGDTLILDTDLNTTSNVGYVAKNIKINGEDGSKYFDDGTITVPVNDGDLDIQFTSVRKDFSVFLSAEISSTLGTTISLSKLSDKHRFHSALFLNPNTDKIYKVDPMSAFMESFYNPATLAKWESYCYSPIEIQFNHKYSWCEYTYKVTSGLTDGFYGWVIDDAQVAANPQLAPYKGFSLYFVQSNNSFGTGAEYKLEVVETPLLTDVTVQFTTSDNPVDYYGENATNWAYLCTDRTHATKINPAVLKDVQIGDTLRLSTNNVDDVCEAKMEFIHEDTVTNTYYIRYDDSDDTQGGDLYSNYFYDIYVNGDSWGPVLTKDWTITKDTVITVDVEHRYKDFSIYFEKDSTNKYGDWDDGQTRNKIPTLTTWSISGRVVTLTLPTDYVTRYGGASYYTDKFIAYEDDEHYSYTWHAIYMDDSSSTATTGTFMNDDSHDFYGNVSREVNNYTINLVDFEDESGESNNWAHWYLKKGSDAEVVVTSMTVPYGTTFKCEALSDDPESLRLLWSPDGGISWWGEEGDETQYICRPIDDTAQYDYSVSSCWLKNMTSVTGDGAIAAQVDRTTKKYKINLEVATGSTDYGDWYTANDGGTVVTDTGELDYGTQCMLLYNPGDDFGALAVGPNTARYYFRPKTRSAQYKYTASFDIATQTSFIVTGDMTITGSMTRETAKYKITVDTDDASWSLTPAQPTDGYDYGTSVNITASMLSDVTLHKLPYSIHVNGSPVSCTTKYTMEVNGEAGIPYNIYTTVTMTGNISCTAAYRSCYEAKFADGAYDTEGTISFYQSTFLRSISVDEVDSDVVKYMTTDVYALFDLTCRSRLAYDEVTANGKHTYYGSGNDERIICAYSGGIVNTYSDGFTNVSWTAHEDPTYIWNYYVSNDTENQPTKLYEYVTVTGEVAYDGSAIEEFCFNTKDSRGTYLTFAEGSPSDPAITVTGSAKSITFTSGAPAFIMGSYSGSETYTLSSPGYDITPSSIDLEDCGTSEYELSFTIKNYNITTSSDGDISWTVDSTATYGSTVTGTIAAINQCYIAVAPTFEGVSGVTLTEESTAIISGVVYPTEYSFSFTMPANDVTIKVTSDPRFGVLNIQSGCYTSGTIYYGTGTTTSVELCNGGNTYFYHYETGVKWNLTSKSLLVYSTGTYGGHSCFGYSQDDRIMTDLGSNYTGYENSWLSSRWLGNSTPYEFIYYNNSAGDYTKSSTWSEVLTVGTSSRTDSTAAVICNNSGMNVSLYNSDLSSYAKTIANGTTDIYFALYSNKTITTALADSTHYTCYIDGAAATTTNFKDSSSSPGNKVTITSAPKSYTISCSADNVTCTGGGTYTYGSSCTITAAANSGYVMKNWSGWVGQDLLEVEGTNYCTNCTYTFTVTGDWAISPDFQATAYHTFTYSPSGTKPVHALITYSNGNTLTYNYTSPSSFTVHYFTIKSGSYWDTYSRAHSNDGWFNDSYTTYYGDGGDDNMITDYSLSYSTGVSNTTKSAPYWTAPGDAYVFVGFNTWRDYSDNITLSYSSTDIRGAYVSLQKGYAQPASMHARVKHGADYSYIYSTALVLGSYGNGGSATLEWNSEDSPSSYADSANITMADHYKPKNSGVTKYRLTGTQGTSKWGTTWAWYSWSWHAMYTQHWSSDGGWIVTDDDSNPWIYNMYNTQKQFMDGSGSNPGSGQPAGCTKTLKIAWYGYFYSSSNYLWLSNKYENVDVYRNSGNMFGAGVRALRTNNGGYTGSNDSVWYSSNSGSHYYVPYGFESSGFVDTILKIKVCGDYPNAHPRDWSYRPMLWGRGIYTRFTQVSTGGWTWTYSTFTDAM